MKNTRKTNVKKRNTDSFPLRKIYELTVLTLPAVLAIAAMHISPMLLLAYFPLYECTRLICGYAFSRFIDKASPKEKRIKSIPDDECVLVVISSMLRGKELDAHLFEKLCDTFFLFNGHNVFFGILADIRDSKTAKAPGDEDTLSYAYGRIDALCSKHGRKFILLERRRSYSKSEEKFICKDGSSGALCELVRLLCGEETTFSEKSVQMLCEIVGGKKIKYLITVKDEVSIGIDTLKALHLEMLQPYNKPIIDEKKGIVTKGHAVMQPKISLRGGNYSSKVIPATDMTYQHLSGRDIFAGSGIIDVDAFHIVLNKLNILPEDKLIDGDILIGERLRCGFVQGTELFGKGYESVFDLLLQRHKKIRSDVQALLCLILQRKKGEKAHKDASSLFLLFDTAITDLAPIFSFLCLILACLTRNAASGILTLYVLSGFAVPFIYELLKIVLTLDFSRLFTRFFSKKAELPIFSELRCGLYSLSMLPMTALYSADAAVRACFRALISKKGLLRDERCEIGEASERGLLDFIHGNIFCAFAGFLLFAFSQGAILRLISVLWFAFPVIAYHCPFDESKSTRESNDLAPYKDKAIKLWQGHAQGTAEKGHNLPRESPYADTTTPSAIGLYMLSVLCARDFGIITSCELYKRLSEVLYTLCSLEAFKGHFYERYDVNSLKVSVPRRISATESAVLTACFITLKAGLSDYANEDTRLLDAIKCITDLEGKTDLSVLYSKKHKLFRKYAEVHEDSISLSDEFLDNYMGTGRLLAYIAIGRRTASAEHFKALRRNYIRKEGYLGLSADSDEVDCLLPYVFLPAYENTLSYEALHFHLRMCPSKVRSNKTALCDLCNTALGKILQSRFMSDRAMRSVAGLLWEEIPTDTELSGRHHKK